MVIFAMATALASCGCGGSFGPCLAHRFEPPLQPPLRQLGDHAQGCVRGNRSQSFRQTTVLMEYKRFIVQAFEREPGKWRARVQRADRKLLWKGRAKIAEFVTAVDVTTPERAMQMALAAIDRGAFSRQPVDS